MSMLREYCHLSTPNSVERTNLGLDLNSTSKKCQNIFYFSKIHRQMFNFQPLIIRALRPTTVITLREEMNLCSTSHYKCLSHHSMGRWRRPESRKSEEFDQF